jgi:hypothetical protein
LNDLKKLFEKFAKDDLLAGGEMGDILNDLLRALGVSDPVAAIAV